MLCFIIVKLLVILFDELFIFLDVVVVFEIKKMLKEIKYNYIIIFLMYIL